MRRARPGRRCCLGSRHHIVARLGRQNSRRVDGVVQPVRAELRRIPRPEEPLGGRHHRGPAHAPGQDPPDGARTDQGWATIHVPRPAGRVRGADPVLEQTHRVVERAHPRHAAPPPRPVPSGGSRRSASGATSALKIRRRTCNKIPSLCPIRTKYRDRQRLPASSVLELCYHFSYLVDSIVPAARKDVAFSNVSYVATPSYP